MASQIIPALVRFTPNLRHGTRVNARWGRNAPTRNRGARGHPKHCHHHAVQESEASEGTPIAKSKQMGWCRRDDTRGHVCGSRQCFLGAENTRACGCATNSTDTSSLHGNVNSGTSTGWPGERAVSAMIESKFNRIGFVLTLAGPVCVQKRQARGSAHLT
jgi:hypothetical protein